MDKTSGKRVDYINNKLSSEDNFINIYSVKLPYRETVTQISEYCDRLKKMITDLDTKRKNEMYECVLDNRMQIGTDHKYAIFDLPGSSGEKMRYFYTFYLDKDRFIQIVSDCVKSEGFCGDTESALDVIVRSIRSK